MLTDKRTIEAYVRPGEIVWSDNSIRIATVLGSCVAVCVWHPHLRHGGLAHCMLPDRIGPATDGPDGRYVDEAFAILLGQMRRFGPATGYQVKLFGGSGLQAHQGDVALDVGTRNAERARSLVAAHGLVLAATDLGGARFRKLSFHLDTGDVWLKRMSLPVRNAGGAR